MSQESDLIISKSFSWGDGKEHIKTFSKTFLPCEINILYLITLFYFRFPKNFVFAGEYHDFWEFLYLDKGKLLITLDSEDYCLKSGEAIFIQPNKFHNIRADGETAFNYIIISFACDSPAMYYFNDKILLLSDYEKKLLSNFITEASGSFVDIETSPPPQQEHFTLSLKDDAPFGTLQMLKCCLEQLIISLYRSKDSLLTQTRNLTSKCQQVYSQTTRNIINILEENLSKKLTTADIAQKLNLSIPQVKSAFHNEVGQGIMSYFSNMKITEAKRLIFQGDLNFTQISEMLGFDSIHYFSRVFKAKTGMTPTEYSLSIHHK